MSKPTLNELFINVFCLEVLVGLFIFLLIKSAYVEAALIFVLAGVILNKHVKDRKRYEDRGDSDET